MWIATVQHSTETHSMPWPDFSELSPDFISQNDEAALGYDVEVAIKNSTPVFFQFKRSFVLTTHRAGEIQNGDFRHPDLYRMYLHKADGFRQHRALRRLEKDGNSVFYVTSQISTYDDLTAAYTANNVVEQAAALFSPAEISLPNRTDSHYLTFRATDNFAYIYSEKGVRFRRRFRSWQTTRGVFEDGRRSTSVNREKLSEIAERLAQGNQEAAQIARRFNHPAIRASILAFLVLDAQLTFYGESKGPNSG